MNPRKCTHANIGWKMGLFLVKRLKGFAESLMKWMEQPHFSPNRRMGHWRHLPPSPSSPLMEKLSMAAAAARTDDAINAAAAAVSPLPSPLFLLLLDSFASPPSPLDGIVFVAPNHYVEGEGERWRKRESFRATSKFGLKPRRRAFLSW